MTVQDAPTRVARPGFSAFAAPSLERWRWVRWRSALLDALVLAALWALQVRMRYVWLAVDSRPPRWDESVFLIMSDAWRHFFQQPGWESLGVAVSTHAWKSPPFWLALMGAVQAIRGEGVEYLVWASNSLALGVLMLATYGIGRQLFGRQAGLAAAALVMVYSGVGLLSYLYLMDLPLTAMIALALFGQVRLLRPRVSALDVALAALLTALAILTRWQAPIFLWLPTLYVIDWHLRAAHQRGRSLRRLAISIALVSAAVGILALVAALLLVNVTSLVEMLSRHTTLALFSANSERTLTWRMWYAVAKFPIAWIEFEFLDQPGLLALAGIGSLVAAIRLRAGYWFPACWVIGALAALVFVHRDQRYDVPLLPALALLSAAPLGLRLGVPHSRLLAWGRTAILLVAVGLLSVLTVAWQGFGQESGPDALTLAFAPPATVAALVESARDRHPSHPWSWLWPAEEEWQNEETLRLLDRARRDLGLRRATIAFTPSLSFLQVEYFRYAAEVLNLPLDFVVEDPRRSAGVRYQVLFGADMVVTKSGRSRSPEPFDAPQELEEFASSLADDRSELGQRFAGSFVPFARLPLPDGSEAILWVKRRLLATLDGIRDLPRATILAQSSTQVTVTAETVQGDWRQALQIHPPNARVLPSGAGATSVRYAVPRLPPQARFRTAIALAPQSWAISDGAEFLIQTVDGEREEIVFRRVLDPRGVPSERVWHEVEIDLSAFFGRDIEVWLMTGPGPSGDNTADWAVWAEPIVLPYDPGRLERLSR